MVIVNMNYIIEHAKECTEVSKRAMASKQASSEWAIEREEIVLAFIY